LHFLIIYLYISYAIEALELDSLLLDTDEDDFDEELKDSDDEETDELDSLLDEEDEKLTDDDDEKLLDENDSLEELTDEDD